MLVDLSLPFNWLRTRCFPPRLPDLPPDEALPDDPLPLAHPDVALPAWVADDPVVQKYRSLLGALPWDQFPERPTDHPWPGPRPDPRAPYVAAYLIKLHEGKRYMSQLRAYLIEHPALVWWLGFPRVADSSAPHGFSIPATVPKRRQFSSVLRDLPNATCQFLLTATVQQLQASLPLDHQGTFGDIIAGDTQAILAWVRENNPKQYIKEGRLTKDRQPAGDPDCKLGIKSRPNTPPAEEAALTPTTEAKAACQLQVGVDIFWGYASGIVATRLPDATEVVLAERTRPFNQSDISYFYPLMEQVEVRLGRRPHFGTWDAAYDAHYVYDYFHQAGGCAAVPLVTKRGGRRRFSPEGQPLCAADLPMTLEFVYQDRTNTLVPHERAKYRCPLLHPCPTGQTCPITDAHFATGGCTTTMANTAGARIRHELDRESENYKQLYAQRSMVERINSQAEALGILHPKLRRGTAIANQNSLTYVLINLRALLRLREAALEGRLSPEATTLTA